MSVESLLNQSALNKVVLSLKTITPLLMHGYNNRQEAEFRVPSIKGVLRYWWRSLQVDSEGLLKKESALFGGAGSGTGEGIRSPLQLHVVPASSRSSFPIRPHRGPGQGSAFGIPADTDLKIEFSVMKRNAELLEFYLSLFEFTLAVSGFGQRARRGYGSLGLVGRNWNNVTEYREYVSQKIEQLTNGRFNLANLPDTKHPVFRNFWVGKALPDETKARVIIGQASSRAKAEAGYKYLLGSISSRSTTRLASPLHASVQIIDRQYYPVVVETNLTSRPNVDYRKQRATFLRGIGVNFDG